MKYDDDSSGEEGDDDDDDERRLNSGQLYTEADCDVTVSRSHQSNVTDGGSARRRSVHPVTYIDNNDDNDVNDLSSDYEAAMMRRPSNNVRYVERDDERESAAVNGRMQQHRRDTAAHHQVTNFTWCILLHRLN